MLMNGKTSGSVPVAAIAVLGGGQWSRLDRTVAKRVKMMVAKRKWVGEGVGWLRQWTVASASQRCMANSDSAVSDISDFPNGKGEG